MKMQAHTEAQRLLTIVLCLLALVSTKLVAFAPDRRYRLFHEAKVPHFYFKREEFYSDKAKGYSRCNAPQLAHCVVLSEFD